MKNLLSVFFLTSLLAGAAYAGQHEKDGASASIGTDVEAGDSLSAETDADAELESDDHYHDHEAHMHGEGESDMDAEGTEEYTD